MLKIPQDVALVKTLATKYAVLRPWALPLFSVASRRVPGASRPLRQNGRTRHSWCPEAPLRKIWSTRCFPSGPGTRVQPTCSHDAAVYGSHPPTSSKAPDARPPPNAHFPWEGSFKASGRTRPATRPAGRRFYSGSASSGTSITVMAGSPSRPRYPIRRSLPGLACSRTSS